MQNVDRWTVYTLQKLNIKGRDYSFYSGNHLPLTPAQRRRCVKKMRKNNDTSIGIS